ncbi:MAG: hypothetical protein OEZ51_11040 [Nitrospinota bacterium]|nr:hypothetical protein [Nitrospinota bacterium]
MNNHSNKSSIGSWVTIGAAVFVAFLFPANLFGESLARTISLEAVDQKQKVSIPVGASVTFLNNYPQELYQTSIITNHSDKRILSIDSFPAGQSFGLEFSKQGPYSICYSLKPEEDSAQPICIQINVVPLQAA